jgi:hypothetical protein
MTGTTAPHALAAALDYAAEGLAVFPCVYRGKKPAVNRGFYAATTNPETIRRWFGGSYPYNLAIRTGLASRAWILDVDDRHGGFAGLGELEQRCGRLPVTRCCRTSNGIHLWWRSNCPIENSEERVGKGLGVKGDGGYAMAPPSIHPDGPTYSWDNDAPIADAPDWLLKLTRKPAPTISERARSSLPSRTGAYGRAALDVEAKALSMVAPGNRNNALNRAAFSLAQLVAGGELDRDEVERRLISAAEANGLLAEDGLRQVQATIRSGMRAGLQHPRSRP